MIGSGPLATLRPYAPLMLLLSAVSMASFILETQAAELPPAPCSEVQSHSRMLATGNIPIADAGQPLQGAIDEDKRVLKEACTKCCQEAGFELSTTLVYTRRPCRCAHTKGEVLKLRLAMENE